LIDKIHGMREQRFANGTVRIWVADLGNGSTGHSVKMFTTDGKLVETIGTSGTPGSSLDPIQFDQVADLAVDQSNSLYIVDGDGGMNNRLVKLDSNRKVVWSTGTLGAKAGQFSIPHSVEFDPNLDIVWVADRDNHRLQAFNVSDGHFVAEWTCMRPSSPYHIRLDPSGHNYIILDLMSAKILVLPAPQNIKAVNECHVIATTYIHPNTTKPHAFSVSKTSGALFVGELGANVTQKYVPYALSVRPPDRPKLLMSATVFEPLLVFIAFAVLLSWILKHRISSRGGKAHYHRVQKKTMSSGS
jgi:hypothetical protein